MYLPTKGQQGAETIASDAQSLFYLRVASLRYPISRMANIGEVLSSAAAIAKGMGITFKEMLQPAVTEEYPDGPAQVEQRFRGAHVLQRDENGLEKCVACFLCAAACPADCIYIEAAENTAEHRVSGSERYASVYNIDYNPVGAEPKPAGLPL